LYADPHARSFDGKYFEAQTAGKYLLHKGPTLTVDYIGKSMGSWVGVVEWIVNVKGDVVRNTGFSGVTVNGNAAQLPSGKKFALPNGGSILHAGNKVTISSESGEEVDFVSFGTFFNAYVRSNLAGVSGLCSHQFVKSKKFRDVKLGKQPKPKLNCPKKAKHMKFCAGKGLKGIAQLNCAFDLCAKLPVAIERKILRQNKRENKQRIKKVITRGPFGPRKPRVRPPPLIVKPVVRPPREVRRPPTGRPPRPVIHRPPPPVVRRPPPPPPRRVVRATRRGRARSDVHLGLKGKDITENFAGIFTFFKTDKVTTQVKYTKFGNGSAITGFAAKAGNSVFEVSTFEDTFEVTFNGKEIPHDTTTESAEFIVIRKGDKKSDVMIDARGVFRGVIVFDPVTKALDVNLNILDKVGKFDGILKDGKGHVHQTSAADSIFKHYVAFERVSGIVNPEWKPLAEKWCHDVLPKWKKDCEKDVMVTGINWSNNYRLEAKDRNDAVKKGAFAE